MRQDFACFLINLDGSDDRLASADVALKAAGLRYDRLSAFDGRQLDLAKFEEYDPDATLRYMGRALVGGEIGCYMSHLKAAQAFLRSDAQHALVLEDDAAPPLDLLEIVNKALAYLDDIDPTWRIVNLGNPSLKIASPCLQILRPMGAVTLYQAHYFPITTSAILWSRNGAHEFIDKHTSIFAPVDNFFRHWITRAGGGYAFSPPLVPTTDAQSNIAQSSNVPRSKTQRHALYGWRKQRRLLVDKLIAFYKKIVRRQIIWNS